MIKITDSFASCGRNLGNKLFTYAVGRIFANELNCMLSIPPQSYIKRSGTNTLFPYGNTDGRVIAGDSYYVCDENLNRIGLEQTLLNCKDKGAFLDGYFSKYDYIRPFKTFVKTIYKDISLENDNLNDVVIMLRDSHCDHTFKLPDEYYFNILEKLTFNNLYICFDHLNRHTSLIDGLQKYSPKLIDLDIMDVFKFITSKNTIIACQGTFSFWASFLSNAKKIYWPITNIGPNQQGQWSVNLTVDDEERFEFIHI